MKEITNARIDEALKREAEALAGEENRTLSNLLETALREYLARRGRWPVVGEDGAAPPPRDR